QRVKYIVESYCLAGDEAESFTLHLDALFEAFKPACLELALTEVLVESWSDFPMTRGLAYLQKVKKRLRDWQTEGLSYRLTPNQFEQITGLDAGVTFRELDAPVSDSQETQPATAPEL
ncbi:MAG: hypothetical protein AAFU71_08210, partial [Cyanobacteria bacterium J06632_22]